ncbi:pteridine reductase [Flocculibacter collagenilyticus]|uniref:pteridine reductase n=1 Tax=Flocculibacter collagenilyticus TaxID=2744479 RepID=UPI0018F2998D|nr:pteridine reductase [Flocculibacter collagenilyticus]
MTVKTAFITGSAKRLGKQTAKTLHNAGYNIIIHCNTSVSNAEQLCHELNTIRADSASYLQANLVNDAALEQLANAIKEQHGRLDVLINNASSFYPTPVESSTLEQWDDLMATNLKAPFFLTKYLSPLLSKYNGCVINMIDIHADKPLKEHSIYCMAKAGLKMMTKSLAIELAPTIRVNGIAPGAILWPEQALSEDDKATIINQIALDRLGTTEEIANTIKFLVDDASYITGQVIAVDGGRSLGGSNKA